MPKQHLTNQFLKSLAGSDKRVEYYDDHYIVNGKLKKMGANGLALRVTTTGRKSFAYRYYIHSTSKRITIGTYPDWSLSEAREKARELAKLIGQGIDPMSERHKRNHKNITLEGYIERFKKEYLVRKLKPSTQKTYKSRLNKVLSSKLANRPIADISKGEIRSFLKQVAVEHPISANRLHSILSKLFNEALQDGIVESNPLQGMSKLSKERPRDVRYTQEDIKKIWNAIEEEWQPLQGILKMLLITGQRLGETRRMKWENIHDGLWIIPQSETKAGRTHEVPLSKMALLVLKEMKQINGGNDYVFASPKNLKPMTHFTGATNRIRSKAEFTEFRLHDFRHIVATGMINLGVEFVHVGKVLNHRGLAASNVITTRYVNTDYNDQKREALKKWADHLKVITTNLKKVKQEYHN